MSDPVPAGDYGTATWQDFNNNWRKEDADFLQSRSVLRYDTTAARDAITPAPAAGTTIYNFQTDRIEYRAEDRHLERPVPRQWSGHRAGGL